MGLHMAKSSNTEGGRAGRVYSASSVHKRRSAPAARAQKTAQSESQDAEPLLKKARAAFKRADGQEEPRPSARRSAASSEWPQAADASQAADMAQVAAAPQPAVQPQAAAAPAVPAVREGSGEVDLGATWEFSPVPAQEVASDTVREAEAPQATGADRASAAPADGQKPAAPGPSPAESGRVRQVPTKGSEARIEARRNASMRGAYRPASNLRRRNPAVRIVAIVFTVLLIALIAAGGLLSWDRWFRYDDSADFQGEWFVHGTQTSVTIDEKSIRMREDITYKYSIDPTSKTIEYRFGTMRGGGRYYFDNDRRQLVIIDGQDYSGFSTLFEDLKRMLAELLPTSGSDTFKAPSGEGIIVFDRTAVQEQEYADALVALGAQREAQKAAQTAVVEGDSVVTAAPSLPDAAQDLAVSDIKAAGGEDSGSDDSSDSGDEDSEDDEDYSEDDEDYSEDDE